MAQIRKGSVRIARAVRPGVIDFTYTNLWSVGDRGTSSEPVLHMGRARAAVAAHSFEIAEIEGLPTHYIEQTDELTIRVEEFAVPGRESLSGKVVGQMIPLEWIWRTRVYGSLLKRIQEGKVDPVSLGFEPGVPVSKGDRLPKMLLECTTKFEHTDRHIADHEARELAGLTMCQWEAAWVLIEQAVAATNAAYESVGFMCPDGKCELGMKSDGSIVLVDVFATQDENRIIKIADGEPYSKDIIREYLWSLPWKDELEKAKKQYPHDKTKWPPYPPLGKRKVLVSERYCEVSEKYAGVHIR